MTGKSCDDAQTLDCERFAEIELQVHMEKLFFKFLGTSREKCIENWKCIYGLWWRLAPKWHRFSLHLHFSNVSGGIINVNVHWLFRHCFLHHDTLPVINEQMLPFASLRRSDDGGSGPDHPAEGRGAHHHRGGTYHVGRWGEKCVMSQDHKAYNSRCIHMCLEDNQTWLIMNTFCLSTQVWSLSSVASMT